MRVSLQWATIAVLAAAAAAAASQLRSERGSAGGGKAQGLLQAAAAASEAGDGKAADLPPGSWGGTVPMISSPTPTPTRPLEPPTSGNGGDDCTDRCSPACEGDLACQYAEETYRGRVTAPFGCRCVLYCPPHSANPACIGAITVGV